MFAGSSFGNLAALLAVSAVSGVLGASPGLGAEPAQDKRMLRHVVLFKFKEGTTAEQVKEIEQAFRQLPKKIDAIKGFEWGTDNSVEMLSDGFTHCFIVSFADEQGRETYLPHPAHKAFVDLVKPRLEKVLVIDFWQKE